MTLGAAAAAAVARTGTTAPAINCMGPSGDDSKGPASVPLHLPIDTQVAWLKRLLPNVRNVGILFDPALNDRRAAEAAAALKQAGYVPVLEPVTGPTALPNALNRLTNHVDVLLALPDTTVYAREHSRYYGEKYRNLPPAISDIRQLPPTSKPELMARFDEWVTDPQIHRSDVEAFVADKSLVGQAFLGRYLVFTTSGSTGIPAILIQDDPAHP